MTFDLTSKPSSFTQITVVLFLLLPIYYYHIHPSCLPIHPSLTASLHQLHWQTCMSSPPQSDTSPPLHLSPCIFYLPLIYPYCFACLSANKSCFLRATLLFLTALYSISSIWRRAISARRALICWLVLSWFTTTLFLMFRARLAYFSVFRVSMKSRSDGLTQAIITVRLDSKKKSCSMKGIGALCLNMKVMMLTDTLNLGSSTEHQCLIIMSNNIVFQNVLFQEKIFSM